MNPARRLRAAYDQALSVHDLSLMPTVVATAKPLPPLGDVSPETIMDHAWVSIDNTCPFNLTYHPALAVPCGMFDGCPISMMLVGKPFAEATLTRPPTPSSNPPTGGPLDRPHRQPSRRASIARTTCRQ